MSTTKPGCKPTTGRYATRAELTYEVWWRWRETEANTPQIARACRVSEAVVSRIIESKEGLQEYLNRKQIEGQSNA